MTLSNKRILDEGRTGLCPRGHTWQDKKDIRGSCVPEGFVVYRCAICGREEEYKRGKD